jgi:hypothetical protein
MRRVYTGWRFQIDGIGALVSKGFRSRFVGLPAGLVLAVVILPAAAGRAQHPTRSHAQGRLALAADKTFQEGVQANLPPHLSTLLGLSKEEECPVKQSVVRTGSQVQGFDVSVKIKNDIVLFVVDETANDQILYLTSPEGTLRKVVSVKAGVGDVVRITDKDRSAFQKEKQFWVDRLVPSGGTK